MADLFKLASLLMMMRFLFLFFGLKIHNCYFSHAFYRNDYTFMLIELIYRIEIAKTVNLYIVQVYFLQFDDIFKVL